MKSLKRVLVTIIAVAFVLSMAVSTVKALPVTDLKSMKVYSVDNAGAKKQIKFKFNPTTYKYDLVVKSNVARIEILVNTKDPTSTAVIDKEALNTRMDQGMNTTTVTVTSTGGSKQVYTLKTKKLSPAEDATYKEDKGKDKKEKKTKKSATVKMNGKEYKITSFSKKDIPKGFVQTTAKYKGQTYDAIKGKVKDLTAFYLKGYGEGFCIYDKDADKFYIMNNVKVKSRMYTIVEPEKEDDILKNYNKKTIRIDGQKVKTWVLDDEKGMFFVYAMNWDGETSLYTYDDQEKCMQRYLIDNDVNAQIEAANQAYDNMKNKRNELVKRYNIFRYIIIGMAVIIVILIFLLIHSKLNKKEKKIKDDEFVTSGMGDDTKDDKKKDDKDEDDIDAVQTEDDIEEVEDDDIDAVPDEKMDIDADDIQITPAEELLDDEKAETPEEIEKPEITDDEPEVVELDDLDDELDEPEEKPVEEPVEDKEKETHKKKREFGKQTFHDGYGDEPTFGTDKESTEGFYGGEVNSENDVLVDLSEDDGPELAEPIEDLADKREIVDTSEIDVDSLSEPEDLKSTLKSMLASDDDDDQDEDDDFEFIDLD